MENGKNNDKTTGNESPTKGLDQPKCSCGQYNGNNGPNATTRRSG